MTDTLEGRDAAVSRPSREAVLAEIAPLVRIIARGVTDGDPSSQDDAEQEGMIAAWQASLARPDAPKQYLVAAARNGVKNLARGRKAFGAPHRSATSIPASSLDALTDREASEGNWDAADPRAEAALDAVLGERAFEQAITCLTPEYREIVRLRFREGLQWGEVAERTGRANGRSLSGTWNTHIKPRLREHLQAA